MKKRLLFKKTSSIFILILLFLFTSCATAELPPKKNIVWPLPPEPPKISYVRSLREPKDIGKKKTFFKKVVEFIFGSEEAPHLIRPFAVASDRKGNIYITDTGLQVVHIFDLEQKKYRQIFKFPGGRMLSPVGVTVDMSGRVYVSDSLLNRVFVYDNQGNFLNDIGEGEDFKRISGVAYNPINGLVYIVDTGNQKVMAYKIKGTKMFEFGKRGSRDGEFNFPTHITIDKDGLIYITDSMNFRIQIFDPDGRFLNKFGRLGNTIGTFSKPKGIAVDKNNNIYVVDGIYDTVQIFNKNGELLMNFGRSGSKEGNFWLPAGISIDINENIYVADTYNQRVEVFKFIGEEQ
ncbi:MAG: 6-bladed beta-propeller [Nitrospirota bacterium]